MIRRKLRGMPLYVLVIVPLLMFLAIHIYNSGDLAQYLIPHLNSGVMQATVKRYELSKTLKQSEEQVNSLYTVTSATTTTTTVEVVQSCQARRSFVFIKTHKSGSTTLIATFHKFAYIHDRYMVVPALDHNNFIGWPYSFVPRNNIIMPQKDKQFQALVNHVVYNRTVMDEIMDPQSVYITVVREPKSHLLSTYNYFGLYKDQGMSFGPEAYEAFLNATEHNKPGSLQNINLTKTHIKTLARNLQSADLGLEQKYFDNSEAILNFVLQIDREFDFILVLERLSESLILMKRKFCWTMQDIMGISKNRRPKGWGYEKINPISAQRVSALNNADMLLYSMAVSKLDTIKKGQEKLEEEIAVYENIYHNMYSFCSPLTKWNTTNLVDPEPLTVEKSEFNEEFHVGRKECVLLLLQEQDFTFLFKCKQYPEHKQCKKQIRYLHELYSLIHGVGE